MKLKVRLLPFTIEPLSVLHTDHFLPADVGGQQVYRLNQDKVLEEIRTKVDRLATDVTAFDRAPDTLGRAYYRIYDDDQAKDHESLPGDTPEQRKELWARREVVLSTLAAWLDPEWVQAARESLGLMA